MTAQQDIIKKYQEHLTKQGLSSATIDRKLSSLRQYLAFIEKKGYSIPNLPLVQTMSVSEEEMAKNEETIAKLAKLGISIKAPPRNILADLLLVRLTKNAIQGIKSLPKLRYSLPYALKYSRPKWFLRYQKWSGSRFLNLAVLLIACSALGIGGYYQFFGKTKEGKILGSVPINMPQFLSFQGRLVDSSNNPIVVPSHFRFSIYTDPTASAAAQLYEEAKWIAPDTDGIFNTLIGDSTTLPASLFKDNASLWLGITVNENAEMTDRQQIATVAYAFNSQYLQGYGVGATNVGANVNEIPVVDANGNIIIAAAGPSLKTTSGTFKIESPTLALMTAVNSGNIGIGISNPGSKLTVSGGLAIGTTSPSSAYLTSRAPYGGMIVEGNVGIGTTSPTQKLDIVGNINALGTGIFGNLSLGGTLVTSTASEINLLDGTLSTLGSVIYGDGTKLANTEVGTSGQVLMSNAAATPTWATLSLGTLGGVSGSGTHDYLTKWNTAGSTLVNSQLYDDGTNVGIGTSVLGTAKFSVMGGNVGIGTTGPGAKLEINDSSTSGPTSIIDAPLSAAQGSASTW